MKLRPFYYLRREECSMVSDEVVVIFHIIHTIGLYYNINHLKTRNCYQKEPCSSIQPGLLDNECEHFLNNYHNLSILEENAEQEVTDSSDYEDDNN
ncbi:hypothetical protein BpHYR1_049040 [Brachionus plicatilis]|uniref:Uncharacterized protein n=1 Tax=Brachionus plicatilis TaxID=10195 RepID=A0A3M7S6F9_BRAPC|nr:hypothetical protein BpHYR1_049040 [Brachionus plicatilis]